MKLSLLEVKELYSFLKDQGYINHEFHPGIHKLLKRIRAYLIENDEGGEDE